MFCQEMAEPGEECYNNFEIVRKESLKNHKTRQNNITFYIYLL